MKTRFLLIVVLLAAFLSACQPSAPTFTGKWTGNVALVTLTQNGDQVTGSVEGYGGQWTFNVTGTVSGSTLTFDGDTPLGPLAIVLSADGQTFQSADPATSFCGSRDMILPDGCGFSGNWKLKASFVPAGVYAQLQQKGDKVTGSAFSPDGAKISSMDSTVNWGKGWQAVGVNAWGNFTLSMTSNEKAFQILENRILSSENCGLREGETSAYVFYFTCSIP